MMMKIFLWVATSLLWLAVVAATAPDFRSKLIHATEESQAIAGQYIVVFDDETTDEQVDSLLSGLVNGRGPTAVLQNKRFKYALNAVVLQFGNENDNDNDQGGLLVRRVQDAKKMETLLKSPQVNYVEEVQRVNLDGEASVDEVVSSNGDQLPVASWGLDRIDQPEGLDNKYHYNYTGVGVDVYVVYSGIRESHVDLAPRVQCGFNAVAESESCDDLFGSGTRMAGTVGGTLYGVAKEVNLISVKIARSDGSTNTALILDGIDFVVEALKNRPQEQQPAIVIYGYLSRAFRNVLNRAFDQAAREGAVVVIPAGNLETNACRGAPGSARKVITVASTDEMDMRQEDSNYGRCVDIFAPGVRITTTASENNTAVATWSGTNPAAAHVAGVAALYIERDPLATANEIRQAILDDATPGVVSDERGSPNLLVSTYNL